MSEPEGQPTNDGADGRDEAPPPGAGVARWLLEEDEGEEEPQRHQRGHRGDGSGDESSDEELPPLEENEEYHAEDGVDSAPEPNAKPTLPLVVRGWREGRPTVVCNDCEGDFDNGAGNWTWCGCGAVRCTDAKAANVDGAVGASTIVAATSESMPSGAMAGLEVHMERPAKSSERSYRALADHLRVRESRMNTMMKKLTSGTTRGTTGPGVKPAFKSTRSPSTMPRRSHGAQWTNKARAGFRRALTP